MRIGQLAKASDTNIQTIRYHEREALLEQASRTRSGYREFSPDTITRVLFIKQAQDLGFTLKEIRELLGVQDKANGSCGDVRAVARAKIRDIEAKIASLESMKECWIERQMLALAEVH